MLEENMEKNPKEKTRLASYEDYDFVSKLSNHQIKEAISVLKHPDSCMDENTRLASLRILEIELALRRPGHPCPRRLNGKP
jgi:hypothetical protein